MNKCYVIGVFPPPYGGATVKCKLIYSILSKKNPNTAAIDIYDAKRNWTKAARIICLCIKAFKSDGKIVYSLDTKRLKAVLKLQGLFPKSFGNTTVLAVGGLFHQKVEEDNALKSALKRCKGVWVEPPAAKEALEGTGFDNVRIFPNPKSEAGCCEPTPSSSDSPIRLVFFSQISKKKGTDEVIRAVDLLDEHHVPFTLDFYGNVSPDVEPYFAGFIDRHPNINYCGIFDSTASSVYSQLNEYDVLLFPSLHDEEGVPGVLVEAKMSGIAVIASDRSHNRELIIEKDHEGFLLHGDYAAEMYETISRLHNDRGLLYEVKTGSYKSRKRFSLEEYAGLLEEI